MCSGRITKGRITKGRITKGRITKGRITKGRTFKRENFPIFEKLRSKKIFQCLQKNLQNFFEKFQKLQNSEWSIWSPTKMLHFVELGSVKKISGPSAAARMG